MLGLVCTGVVTALAFYAVVSGFRDRAFKAGRGQTSYTIALSSSPFAYWTMAVVLSVVCGAGLGIILHALVHR